jgi:hypothetical protein
MRNQSFLTDERETTRRHNPLQQTKTQARATDHTSKTCADINHIGQSLTRKPCNDSGLIATLEAKIMLDTLDGLGTIGSSHQNTKI